MNRIKMIRGWEYCLLVISIAFLSRYFSNDTAGVNALSALFGLFGIIITFLRVRQLKFGNNLSYLLIGSFIGSIALTFSGLMGDTGSNSSIKIAIPFILFGLIYFLISIYSVFSNSINEKPRVNLFEKIDGFQLFLIQFFIITLIIWLSEIGLFSKLSKSVTLEQSILTVIIFLILGGVFLYFNWIRSKELINGFNPFIAVTGFSFLFIIMIFLDDIGVDIFESSSSNNGRKPLKTRNSGIDSSINFQDILIIFSFLSFIFYQFLMYFKNLISGNSSSEITKYDSEIKILEYKKMLDKGLIDKSDYKLKTKKYREVLLDDNAPTGKPSFFNLSSWKVIGVSSFFILLLSVFLRVIS